MSARTASEIEALAKLAYEAHREVLKALPPWEQLKALEHEAWRSVVRSLDRAMKV